MSATNRPGLITAPRECACGVTFVPSRRNQIYHSERCKKETSRRFRATLARNEVICRHRDQCNAELLARGLEPLGEGE